jgi:hypothetical protein
MVNVEKMQKHVGELAKRDPTEGHTRHETEAVRPPSRKAGCLERGSSGLGGGSMKPTRREASTAHRFYPHCTVLPPACGLG